MICKSHPELSIISLPYSKDAALSWFTPLSGLPWAMILRSAAEAHPDNRYDILVADPLATIESQSDTTYIKFSNGDQRSTTDDPFAVINALQHELLPPLSTELDLPFLGGALGYFSYDLGRRVEKMATTANHDIHLPEMAVGIYDWALIVDQFTEMMLGETGLTGMIGKAERGPATIESIKHHKAVYLMAVGGAAYLVAKAIKKARVVAFADLGMEAIYEFEVEDMPVTVAVDAEGVNAHQTGPDTWRVNIAEMAK